MILVFYLNFLDDLLTFQKYLPKHKTIFQKSTFQNTKIIFWKVVSRMIKKNVPRSTCQNFKNKTLFQKLNFGTMVCIIITSKNGIYDNKIIKKKHVRVYLAKKRSGYRKKVTIFF